MANRNRTSVVLRGERGVTFVGVGTRYLGVLSETPGSLGDVTTLHSRPTRSFQFSRGS